MNLLQAIEKEDTRASLNNRVIDLLQLIENLGYDALPVVNEGMYMGLVFAETLREVTDQRQKLSETKLSFKQLFLHEDQHILEAISYFASQECSILPVVTHRQTYVGFITLKGLAEALEQVLDSSAPGGYIVLEVGLRDNALSHIAHIVESTDAQILSSFTQHIPDSTRMLITLKVNVSNLSNVQSALQRHDYNIISSSGQETMDEDLHARYENLMNYIKM